VELARVAGVVGGRIGEAVDGALDGGARVVGPGPVGAVGAVLGACVGEPVPSQSQNPNDL